MATDFHHYRHYLIGKGNLGSHIQALFLQHSIDLEYVNANQFATKKKEFDQNSFIWLCIPDRYIPDYINQLESTDASLVYCSGALELEPAWKHRVAVWYPLYSFRKELQLIWKHVPIFIECYTDNFHKYFNDLNLLLGLNSTFIDSQKRSILHLTAVFVNNFTNALLAASENILKKSDMQELKPALIPIAIQTIERWNVEDAKNLQTGPAARQDVNTLAQHKSQLEGFPAELELYNLLSKYIQQKIQQNH